MVDEDASLARWTGCDGRVGEEQTKGGDEVMSFLKRLTEPIGFQLPIVESIRWWVKIRPQPVYLPRLPEKLMPDEVTAWIRNRPKVMR